jgi:hypothetical protein
MRGLAHALLWQTPMPFAFTVGQLAVLPVALLAAAPAAADEGAVNGLYPLWEQTAILHRAGSFQIGYEHAQVGLGPVQVGTQPILAVHGTLNLEAKVALWRGEHLALALVVGGYRLPTAAEGRTIGNLYPSGFTNPYAPVWLVPISFAKSLRFGPRVQLHWASTLLLSQSEAAEHRYLSGGQTLMLELAASPRWSARVHGGAEGWPVQTMAHAGLSFAYTGDYLYAAAGAGRRFSLLEGEASNVVMFDAGLLFR